MGVSTVAGTTVANIESARVVITPALDEGADAVVTDVDGACRKNACAAEIVGAVAAGAVTEGKDVAVGAGGSRALDEFSPAVQANVGVARIEAATSKVVHPSGAGGVAEVKIAERSSVAVTGVNDVWCARTESAPALIEEAGAILA